MTEAPEVGFAAAILAKTKAVFLEHYSKALTVALAALFGWASVYATAWVGALPLPAPPQPAPAAVAREDPLAARLGAIETVLRELRAELAARQKRPSAPK